jgi:hypothetical protein
VSGPLEEDLSQLQELVKDDTPAYLLVRLDDPPSGWLAITYIPDSSKVRDKVNAKSLAALLANEPAFPSLVDAVRVHSRLPHKVSRF